MDQAGMRVQEDERFATLSRREREVLAQLAEGLSTKEIAHNLNISCGTAGVHVAHIYEKLGVNKAVVAVRLAIRCGVLTP
jgi:DNA-binding CsgD family transcriptional regulator